MLLGSIGMNWPESSPSIDISFDLWSDVSDATPSTRTTDPPAPREDQGADPLLGRVVAGRYRIRRRIGRGGMGVVYEVEHIAIGKLLAMKLLSGELAQEQHVIARFEREARAASRLQHPNTVQVFDYGSSDGLTFLVMELVRGEPLSAVIRREGPLSSERVTKIAIQICHSLAEAHERGIVHRDIKPDNIMLSRAEDGSDVVKVLDFGLAKLRESESANVISRGMILGTPHYMSPEQVLGSAVDGQADIYGVGALMYVALTGQHIFSGTPIEVLRASLTMPALDPVRRFPKLDIDPGLNAIVASTLRKDPQLRPRGAEGLRAALKQIEHASCVYLRSEDIVDLDTLHGAELLPASRLTNVPKLATRDDVDAYERRLRKRRHGSTLALVAAATMGLTAACLFMARPRPFDGKEHEPNNAFEEATVLPLGQEVQGHLGQRIDARTPDRDFYFVRVAKQTPIRVDVSALPNVAVCASLYSRDLAANIGRWCAAVGVEVSGSVQSVATGDYYVEVGQDPSTVRGPAAIQPNAVTENVSDPYRLVVAGQ